MGAVNTHLHSANLNQKRRRITTSGGPFATIPREIVRTMLKYFTIYEVAQLQRLVCLEFRDAGQERIHERGGKKLFEEGMAFWDGLDNQILDEERGWLLLQASRGAGCRMDAIVDKLDRNLYATNEEKQKILKDLKEITTKSPYHWVDYYIGKCYNKGFGGEEHKHQAVVWLNRAINGGNTQAMVDLGHAYEDGRLGLTQSSTKANEFYALSKRKSPVLHALSSFHYLLRRKWYNKRIDAQEARFNLGNRYENGNGVEIDFNRCVELWEQSAKQGHVGSQFALSCLYRTGSEDNENGNRMTIPKNHPLHFKWALAAAKQGDADGQRCTGDCYDAGWGVEQNYASAFEWYMKAAEQENAVAQLFIGDYFEEGKGRDIDLIQALFWYRKAAAQEDQEAMAAVERLA